MINVMNLNHPFGAVQHDNSNDYTEEMVDHMTMDVCNSFTPVRLSLNKKDFLLRSKLKLSISGELFSTVNKECEREEIKDIPLPGEKI